MLRSYARRSCINYRPNVSEIKVSSSIEPIYEYMHLTITPADFLATPPKVNRN